MAGWTKDNQELREQLPSRKETDIICINESNLPDNGILEKTVMDGSGTIFIDKHNTLMHRKHRAV